MGMCFPHGRAWGAVAVMVLALVLLRAGPVDGEWINSTFSGMTVTVGGVGQIVEVGPGSEGSAASSDDYWTKITIAAGSTLAILPGTDLRFHGGYHLDVQGTVTVVGTEQDRIKVGCADPNDCPSLADVDKSACSFLCYDDKNPKGWFYFPQKTTWGESTFAFTDFVGPPCDGPSSKMHVALYLGETYNGIDFSYKGPLRVSNSSATCAAVRVGRKNPGWVELQGSTLTRAYFKIGETSGPGQKQGYGDIVLTETIVRDANFVQELWTGLSRFRLNGSACYDCAFQAGHEGGGIILTGSTLVRSVISDPRGGKASLVIADSLMLDSRVSWYSQGGYDAGTSSVSITGSRFVANSMFAGERLASLAGASVTLDDVTFAGDGVGTALLLPVVGTGVAPVHHLSRLSVKKFLVGIDISYTSSGGYTAALHNSNMIEVATFLSFSDAAVWASLNASGNFWGEGASETFVRTNSVNGGNVTLNPLLPGLFLHGSDDCVEQPPPEHGDVGDCTGEITNGFFCHTSCNAGYGQPAASQCLFGYMGQPACVGLPCDTSLAPENGFAGDCSGTLASGESCQPLCSEGYTVSGPSTCLLGNLTAAQCLPDPCDASAAPKNGSPGNCTSNVMSGESCQLLCNVGYTVSGPVTCLLGNLTAAQCLPVVTISLEVALVADKFEENAFRLFLSSISIWMQEVQEDVVTDIACICPSSCDINPGETITGDSCGIDVAAVRYLLQNVDDGNVVEILVEVTMKDSDSVSVLVAMVRSEEGQRSLASNLTEFGEVSVGYVSLDGGISREEPIVESVSADQLSSAAEIENRNDPSTAFAFVGTGVVTLVAPLALSYSQNREKRSAINIALLGANISIGWFSVLSCIWSMAVVMLAGHVQFALPYYLIGTLVLASGTSAGVMVQCLRRNALTSSLWEPQNAMVALLSITTNSHLMCLLPWSDDSFHGFPDKELSLATSATEVVLRGLTPMAMLASFLVLEEDVDFAAYIVVGLGTGLCTLNTLMRMSLALFYFLSPSERHEYDVFISHDWGTDALGRDNHTRASLLNTKLKQLGLRTWFDEERLASGGTLDVMMMEGLDASRSVIVCATVRYMEKISGSANNDNCCKEFQHALATKGRGKMLAVVMEPGMANPSVWTGPLKVHLGGALYAPFFEDGMLEDTVRKGALNVLDWVQNKARAEPAMKSNKVAPAELGSGSEPDSDSDPEAGLGSGSGVDDEDDSKLMKKATRVFLAHDWGEDELGLDSAARALALASALGSLPGVEVRVQPVEGSRTILFSRHLEEGIRGADCAIVCVTQRYMHRVAGNDTDDPVFRTFEFANAELGRERILPVAMERRVLDKAAWTGMLRFHLGTMAVVDLTDDAYREDAVHGSGGIASFLASWAPR